LYLDLHSQLTFVCDYVYSRKGQLLSNIMIRNILSHGLFQVQISFLSSKETRKLRESIVNIERRIQNRPTKTISIRQYLKAQKNFN
jgi:hypothetical protein